MLMTNPAVAKIVHTSIPSLHALRNLNVGPPPGAIGSREPFMIYSKL